MNNPSWWTKHWQKVAAATIWAVLIGSLVYFMRANDLTLSELFLAALAWVQDNPLAPLAYIAMLVVAMPFVFGPQRTAGTGQRLLIGLLLGLLFFLSNYLLGNVVLLYGFPPLVGATAPTLLFLGAGFFALRRLR